MSLQQFCINNNMSLFIFPSYLYFDQEVVTFSHNIPRDSDITFNWSAKVKVREYGSILTLMGVVRDLPASEGSLGLLTEYMERGSLYKALHTQSGTSASPNSTSMREDVQSSYLWISLRA